MFWINLFCMVGVFVVVVAAAFWLGKLYQTVQYIKRNLIDD